jgi:hypothetical protein
VGRLGLLAGLLTCTTAAGCSTLGDVTFKREVTPGDLAVALAAVIAAAALGVAWSQAPRDQASDPG